MFISSISLCGGSGIKVILMLKKTRGEILSTQGKQEEFCLDWSVATLNTLSNIALDACRYFNFVDGMSEQSEAESLPS